MIDKYKGTRLYKWLLEDLDYISALNNSYNITDQWILDNYSCYNTDADKCRVSRSESNYSCIKCGSRYIRVDTNQARRADESATTIYTCISCGNVSTIINDKF